MTTLSESGRRSAVWLTTGWRALAIVFLVALAPRLAYLALFGVDAPSADAATYLRKATSIWNDGVYGRGGVPCASDHVLYVLFLAPFVGLSGAVPMAALVTQCALSASCALMAFWVGWRSAGALGGWLAGLCCATYLPSVVYSGLFLTEILSVFWLYAAVCLGGIALQAANPAGVDADAPPAGRGATRASGSVPFSGLAGVAFALLALTRMAAFPLLVAFPVVSVACLWRTPRRAALLVAVFLVGFAAAYSPWVIRNAIVFDRLILLRDIGVTTILDNEYSVEVQLTKGYGYHEARAIAFKHARDSIEQGASAPRTTLLSSKAVRYFPQRLSIMLGFHPAVPAPYPLTGTMVDPFPWLRWFNYGWHYAMFTCALVALGIAVVRMDRVLLLSLAAPIALLGVHSLAGANPRYQIPIFATMAAQAGVGAAVIIRLLAGFLTTGRRKEKL